MSPSARSDARRNRELLVTTARRMLTESAGKVALEAIAREAGVGIGTLYRHFPTREALVEAVYRAERDQLCDQAAHLLRGRTAAAALRLWMDRFADYVATKRDLADAMRALIEAGTVTSAEARARLSTAVQMILDAGAADGTLRADIHAEDVVAGLVGIALACGRPEQREQADRLADLLLAGLRPGCAPG